MNIEPETVIPPKTVLVAGTGRSGTSWLGKILDSSPSVFYKSQPDDCSRYPWFKDIPSRLDPTPEFDRFRRPFAEAISQAFWAFSANLHNRPDFPKTFLRQPAWQALNFTMRAWRKLTRGGSPIIKIPPWLFREDPFSPTLVIKSVVSNFRLAWVHRHFPQVKIILIIRHPGGYLNSIFKGPFPNIGKKQRLDGTVLPFRHREHHQYAEAIERGSDFEREIIYWIVANETPILELANSSALKVVVYEDLCARPMEVADQIFDFAEIPFTESTKQFLRESTTREQAGYHDVYKDPMRAAFKWRAELSGEQIAIINEHLEPHPLKTFWDQDPMKAERVAGVVFSRKD